MLPITALRERDGGLDLTHQANFDFLEGPQG